MSGFRHHAALIGLSLLLVHPSPAHAAKADAGLAQATDAGALPSVPKLTSAEHLAEGIKALGAKDALLAQAHLSACVSQSPEDAECHWQLGWAYWLMGDFANVVAQWRTVKTLQPAHPDLEAQLAAAEGQLELRKKLEASARAAPTPRKTPLPEGSTLRLRAAGDVMLGTVFPEGYLPPEDGAHLLDGVKDLLQDADLTFINLEGPLCENPAPSKKCARSSNCYAFRVPTRYGQYLKDAGVDVVSTANNHAGDFGEPCRRETEATMDKLGIAWSGPPGTIAHLERNGLRIALVAFHTSASTNDVNDLGTAAALVKAAKKDADLVIVSFHGGAEGKDALHVKPHHEMFFGEDRGDLRAFAHTVIDAGAALVLGHGPHVPRAMELYKGHFIAYSMGNFATYGRFSLAGPTATSMVLELTVDARGRFVSGKILPTKLEGQGVPMKDPDHKVWDYVRMLSREDFPESGVEVDQEGGIVPPKAASAK